MLKLDITSYKDDYYGKNSELILLEVVDEDNDLVESCYFFKPLSKTDKWIFNYLIADYIKKYDISKENILIAEVIQ